MKIGILCHPGCGGSTRVAVELAGGLVESGHEVHLLSQARPFALRAGIGVELHTPSGHDRPCADPGRLHTRWNGGELEAFVELALRVTREIGLDILHFHYAVPFARIAANLARRIGKRRPRLVGTLHGTDISVHGRRPPGARGLRTSLAAVDRLSAPSAYQADLATALLGLARRPLVIPNFVDIDRFASPASSVWGAGGRPSGSALGGRISTRTGCARIVHVSNMRWIKDVERVAAIVLGVLERRPVEFWLVGPGDPGPVRELFHRAGRSSALRTFGLVSDVVPLLARTDLLLLASRDESFCLAALEAQALGVPVVAPRRGGLPEVVVDGRTGTLVPYEDFDGFVSACADLLSDPEKHAAFARAGIDRARLFARPKLVGAYEELYRRLLSDAADEVPTTYPAAVATSPI